MTEKKYRLIRAGKMALHPAGKGHKNLKFYHLQALRDIPEHGVKAGDFGGYVSSKKILSHEGSCWVGGEAQVYGKVRIKDDAYIGDKAVVYWCYDHLGYCPGEIYIRGKARVTENAVIKAKRILSNTSDWDNAIEGNAHIYNNAYLLNVNSVSDDAKIYGNACLKEAKTVSGTSEIFGNASIERGGIVEGISKIFDYAVVKDGALIKDSIIAGITEILPKQKVVDGKFNETKIGATMESLKVLENPKTLPIATILSDPSKNNLSLKVLREVQENLASYETDIVKLIKYPAMVDQSIPETMAMTLTLKKALRFSEQSESNEFRDAVNELEQHFVLAESNAIKMVGSILSPEQLKKTHKAKALLRIAENEGSSEQEKKVSFRQAFKQLEGVIAVPEIAMDTFRVKIGLKEIEA